MHSVIVVSAGTGSRYVQSVKNGGCISPVHQTPLKTLEPLPSRDGDTPGMPVFLHSLLLFTSQEFGEIILVVSPEELEKGQQGVSGSFTEELRAWKKIHPPVEVVSQKLTIVAGGKERYHSVANGLQCVSKNSAYVWIHDAARPLLHPDDLRLLQQSVEHFRDTNDVGVLPVQLPTHSIKAVNERGLVTQNIPRDTLREASTPQVFPTRRLTDIYRQLLQRETKDNPTVIPTDDSELYFNAGYPVQTVTLTHPNPKLTVASDHAYMSELLNERKNQSSK